MGEVSQLEAYKQLLELTENLISSLAPGEELLRKYHTLKKSILAKIIPTSVAPTPASNSNYNSKISIAYKEVIQHLLQGISHFEAEIEGEMSRSSFLKNSKKVIESINKQTRLLADDLERISDSSKNLKLLLKEESNTFKYVAKQIQGKIQNMGLMIEVHRKMHEIIMEASDKEARRMKKEQENNKKIEEMETLIEQISDMEHFVEAYDITQKKARQFELAKKNLAKVLFDL